MLFSPCTFCPSCYLQPARVSKSILQNKYTVWSKQICEHSALQRPQFLCTYTKHIKANLSIHKCMWFEVHKINIGLWLWVPFNRITCDIYKLYLFVLHYHFCCKTCTHWICKQDKYTIHKCMYLTRQILDITLYHEPHHHLHLLLCGYSFDWLQMIQANIAARHLQQTKTVFDLIQANYCLKTV